MRRFIITVGLCVLAQAGWAGEGDAPERRPTLCRIEGSPQFYPCSVVWKVSVQTDLVQKASYQVEPMRHPAATPARKITRLPWIIGAFQ